VRVVLFVASLFLFSVAYTESLAITVNNIEIENITIPAIQPVQALIASRNTVSTEVVGFVKKTVASIHHNHYKLGGTYFDLSHGKYNIDCSSYVDDLLKTVSPRAYYTLAAYTGTNHPTTEHYFDFFRHLTTTANQYWNTVKNVKELRPGDILVLRFKKSSHAEEGHIMIVMNKPVPQGNGYVIRVADSAPFAHSEDTRTVKHTSGIGVGTMLVKSDPETGKLSSYAWKLDAPYRNNVHFEMARVATV